MIMRYGRGDTLVELILAVAIFSLASVSALVLMNRGIALSQNGLEVTLVREQMDGQAETIRYLRDTSNSAWDTVKSHADGTAVAALTSASCPTPGTIQLSTSAHGFFISKDPGSGAFVVTDADASHFEKAATYAKIDFSAQKAQGLWVQVTKAENNNGSAVAAYDVYIHACWDSVATTNMPSTLGTIVRIYDK